MPHIIAMFQIIATCQLAIWTENVVKFELQVSGKNGKQSKTKTRGEWSERHNKNGIECGKCR